LSDNDDYTPSDPVEEGQADDVAAAQPVDLGHVSPDPVPVPRTAAETDETLDALKDATANLRALNQRIEALEAEKAARNRADEAARSEVWVHPNTHVLVLSNGGNRGNGEPVRGRTTRPKTASGPSCPHVINPE
jgi:hypothetical protein